MLKSSKSISIKSRFKVSIATPRLCVYLIARCVRNHRALRNFTRFIGVRLEVCTIRNAISETLTWAYYYFVVRYSIDFFISGGLVWYGAFESPSSCILDLELRVCLIERNGQILYSDNQTELQYTPKSRMNIFC